MYLMQIFDMISSVTRTVSCAYDWMPESNYSEVISRNQGLQDYLR